MRLSRENLIMNVQTFDPRLSSIITSKKMLNDAKDLFEAQMKREL